MSDTPSPLSPTHDIAKPLMELYCENALEYLKRQPANSVDVVFGSPPYCDARTYGGGGDCEYRQWVEWMLDVTTCALNATRNVVVWVVNSVTRNHCYRPAIEGLQWEADKAGLSLERPVIWAKNGYPTNRPWFTNTHEHILCFKKAASPVPYFDWESVAEPPAYKSAGKSSNRTKHGRREAYIGWTDTKGLARPRDIIYAAVGGGHMGSQWSHESEAPYPESLVEQILPALCPVGGTVLDPFCGSGTTLAVALKNGRRGIGVDIRQSQIDLTRRRLADVAKGMVEQCES